MQIDVQIINGDIRNLDNINLPPLNFLGIWQSPPAPPFPEWEKEEEKERKNCKDPKGSPHASASTPKTPLRILGRQDLLTVPQPLHRLPQDYPPPRFSQNLPLKRYPPIIPKEWTCGCPPYECWIYSVEPDPSPEFLEKGAIMSSLWILMQTSNRMLSQIFWRKTITTTTTTTTYWS